MRGILIRADRVQTGDELVGDIAGTVARKLGVQGRKPVATAPLMRLVLAEGHDVRVREDTALRIKPRV